MTLNGRAHQPGLPNAIIDDRWPFVCATPGSAPTASTTASSAAGVGRWRCARWPPTGAPSNTCAHPREATIVALAEVSRPASGVSTRRCPTRSSVDLGGPAPVIDLREATPAVLRADQYQPVRAGLRLDGPGRRIRRCLHHRRGSADVPAARRAMDLIRRCAKRFPGGQMFFDLPPIIRSRPERYPRLQELPGAAYAVQSVDQPVARSDRPDSPDSKAVPRCSMPAGRFRLHHCCSPRSGVSGPMKPFRVVYALLSSLTSELGIQIAARPRRWWPNCRAASAYTRAAAAIAMSVGTRRATKFPAARGFRYRRASSSRPGQPCWNQP